MHLGIIVAMEEELEPILPVLTCQKVNKVFQLYQCKRNNLQISIIVSNIGKAAAASATTYLIENYNPDFLLNIGTCGGVNNTNIASIILANSAAYHDVDVRAFGYKLGQLPKQVEVFSGGNQTVKFQDLSTFLKNRYPLVNGLIITGDQFVANKDKVNIIKNMYPNIVAIDMEAAAIAQVCLMYKKNFAFLKKVSDLADADATDSFKNELIKMNQQIPQIVLDVLNYLEKLGS
ncbi:5'-methylthioadenosine/S-adenosylhomocysteine nucleosidase [Candidatus Hepatincola sp. Av]